MKVFVEHFLLVSGTQFRPEHNAGTPNDQMFLNTLKVSQIAFSTLYNSVSLRGAALKTIYLSEGFILFSVVRNC